jgi:hypothetical protein
MDMFHLPDKSCYIDVKFDDFENHSCWSNTSTAAPILLAGSQHKYEEALYFMAVEQHPSYWRRIGLIAFWVCSAHRPEPCGSTVPRPSYLVAGNNHYSSISIIAPGAKKMHTGTLALLGADGAWSFESRCSCNLPET